MVPVLFVTPGSCGLGSLIALEWLGKPYCVSRLSVSDHSDPRYLALSPLGEVPALMTESGVLTESLAILHHLGTQDASGRTVPRDVHGFDQFNQSLAYLVSTFHAAFRPIFHADRFALTEMGRKEAHDAAIARLSREYAHIEAVLQRTGWFAGAQPSAADAYFLGLARWGDAFVDDRTYPNIRRVRERMSEDPAVEFAFRVERGEVAASGEAFAGFVDLKDVVADPPNPGIETLSSSA